MSAPEEEGYEPAPAYASAEEESYEPKDVEGEEYDEDEEGYEFDDAADATQCVEMAERGPGAGALPTVNIRDFEALAALQRKRKAFPEEQPQWDDSSSKRRRQGELSEAESANLFEDVPQEQDLRPGYCDKDLYWLLPGMQINEDGLRLISEDKDALSMVGMVKQGHKFLMVYFDHEPVNKVVKWDDVVDNPVANLPLVISPSKNSIVEVNDVEGSIAITTARLERRSNRNAADEEEDFDSDNSSDSDYESGIVDSDNDTEQGYDDLYQQYADQESKGEKKVILEGANSDEEFFKPTDSDVEAETFKTFKPFVQEDMHDPKILMTEQR